MPHHRIVPLTLAAILGLAACGSDSSTGTASPEPSAAAVATNPTQSTAPSTQDSVIAASDETATTTESAREEVVIGDLPTSLPTEPCGLLSSEQVATVLSGADAGTPTVTAAAAACEWSDATGTTALELVVYDTMGEDMSAITPEMLIDMRAPDGQTTLEPIEFDVPAIAGPENEDAVIQWITLGGLHQLRLWAVGAAPRPGDEWASLEQPMTELARAIVANSGG